jgi:hypothetical protein
LLILRDSLSGRKIFATQPPIEGDSYYNDIEQWIDWQNLLVITRLITLGDTFDPEPTAIAGFANTGLVASPPIVVA